MGLTSKAAAVTPPVVGQNVWALPANDWSTTNYLTVPDAWKDAIVRFHAVGDEDWYIGFGDITLAGVTLLNESTVSSNAVTAIGSCCYQIEKNTYVDFDLTLLDAKHKIRLGLLSETGPATNFLRITRTSGQVRA